MKQKYALLLALQSFEFEIHRLRAYSEECPDCYELLQSKLDALCQFMTSDENEALWRQWGNTEEIRQHGERVRSASNQALCYLEKYQSSQLLSQKTSISEYLSILSSTVRRELLLFGMDSSSKILFIGSGAFPVSALTMAQETGAKVFCLDTDEEAVALGKRVTEAVGLITSLTFSGCYQAGLSFLEQATHVVVASLVDDKHELLGKLQQSAHEDVKIIVRYGNGLKSIFNFPFDVEHSDEWEITPIVHGKRIYDTVMLQRKRVREMEVTQGG
ncbi:nicotianamine synthase family protein [Paenibacillus sp. UMB4589-SE434]|uniref:nicotianamine synthase family protein n=1 Tax=Paenibacillus sp. UMB4589-SE434 TaxID=3046314 RepID=UPI002549CFF9|nr:nicotianamine synthase family protein [Paenibacillus sp. UMB4589-SE434]MDK8180234.1 nicotianamine synthase family protein [Paenibacillus sp. UMB4589-SE434]